MTSLFFELCVESLEAARAAQAGGANQIELCAGLSDSGVTPPVDLITAVVQAVSIPVSVLIRPRFGSFAFTPEEFALMGRQIELARHAGAAAVALGALLPDHRVDIPRTRELVEQARPMSVTFHRAFDEAPDLSAALEDVIATGAGCLLTSGGSPDVLSGAATIGDLRRQARGRIRIMAGGGLRLQNLAEVVHRSGVTMLHSSLIRANGITPNANGDGLAPLPPTPGQLLQSDLREAIYLFHQVFQERTAPASPAD
ncbi:MAG TPA: copper homeostasis protein CutC [Terracidiphilus sp.]|nr:copper homeostasis protein CutC [Terracidiphilus sp.]